MDSKVANINKRIKELNEEIHNLEQQLSAMNWERKKYLQFSVNKSETTSRSTG